MFQKKVAFVYDRMCPYLHFDTLFIALAALEVDQLLSRNMYVCLKTGLGESRMTLVGVIDRVTV